MIFSYFPCHERIQGTKTCYSVMPMNVLYCSFACLLPLRFDGRLGFGSTSWIEFQFGIAVGCGQVFPVSKTEQKLSVIINSIDGHQRIRVFR